MHLSNRTYDFLKWAVMIVLPAIAALYYGLAFLWGFPNAEQVVGSVALVTVFLGTVLGFSSRNYNKSDAKYDGTMITVMDPEDPSKGTMSLELNDSPEGLMGKSAILFKVVNSQ